MLIENLSSSLPGYPYRYELETEEERKALLQYVCHASDFEALQKVALPAYVYSRNGLSGARPLLRSELILMKAEQ